MVGEKKNVLKAAVSPLIRISHINEWETEKHSLLFIKPLVENIIKKTSYLPHNHNN
ncbi:MAG: hypothetical protein H6Q74_313 [Firmicutes bacterium]|nr:hypothetical protein [Bacillota bacterium]